MNRGRYADYSGTITAGGTAQTIIQANPSRHGVLVMNNSDTDMVLGVGHTATATKGIVLVPGAYWESPTNFIPTDQISLFCATTSKEFTAYEA